MLNFHKPSMAHILIIDDDLLICQLLRRILEQLGHRVTDAQDGRKGLNAFQADPADLVITDLIMPGMEGIETIMEMKRRFPGTKIIAMSGGGVGSGSDYLQMARKFGALQIITKPFSVEMLTKLVTEVLAGSPAGTAGSTSRA